MKKNTTPVVDAIGELNFEGNIIPHSWYQNIKLPSGKTDTIAITLLSHIAYGIVKNGDNPILQNIGFTRDSLMQLPFFLTDRQVSDALVRLTKAGLLIATQLTDDEIVTILSDKHEQLFRDGRFNCVRCLWCNAETFILHEHHYPIPAGNGGTETVGICSNCHSEFHHLKTVGLYLPTHDAIEKFNEVCNGN